MRDSFRLLDSHVHLLDKRFTGRLESVLDRAAQAGVERMFCNATQESDWQEILNLSKTTPAVLPFLGIHPWFADTVTEGWEKRLDDLLATHRTGLGETGLDKRCGVNPDLQEEVFLIQLRLALKHDLPLVIHCLHRWGRLIELLETHLQGDQKIPLMIHSFSGSEEIMRRLVHLGCFISYSMRLTDASQGQLRKTFKATPLERILIETDAPDQLNVDFLVSDNEQSAGNEPSHIRELSAFAADLREMNTSEFCVQIWKNGEIYSHSALPR
jgi:TatD DNase family protein